MKKCLIWGTGGVSLLNYRFFKMMPFFTCYEVIAFVDNNSEKWGTFIEGKPCISPYEMVQYEWDIICIWSAAKQQISNQIIQEFKIEPNKIEDILKPFYDKLFLKYGNSNDKEIQSILNKIRTKNKLNIFYYQPEADWRWYEAFYDIKKDLYYIYFEEKKMYISRNYNLEVIDGKKYVHDIWREQDKNSPHRYESDYVSVQTGDILVDGGACEGNFTLHNIEKVKKAYIVECDTSWIEALRFTFEPWGNKIAFCSKFLTKSDSEKTITIDTLTRSRADFIKLDVEGEEINALSGAENTFANNKNLRCSICTYHKSGDEDKVKKLFSEKGLECEVSDGYMLFLHDPNVLENPELRRGIVRGYKK
ncbi:hypothetical protein D7V86_17145 [bacterium D16-51]|nr:hypothetical protein D7V96_12200 [bacterium D16-59]RKI57734.1 hypothetical protein D7V86_17145 [bacterium D16-51]